MIDLFVVTPNPRIWMKLLRFFIWFMVIKFFVMMGLGLISSFHSIAGVAIHLVYLQICGDLSSGTVLSPITTFAGCGNLLYIIELHTFIMFTDEIEQLGRS